MKCPCCGKEWVPGKNFCTSCGTPRPRTGSKTVWMLGVAGLLFLCSLTLVAYSVALLVTRATESRAAQFGPTTTPPVQFVSALATSTTTPRLLAATLSPAPTIPSPTRSLTPSPTASPFPTLVQSTPTRTRTKIPVSPTASRTPIPTTLPCPNPAGTRYFLDDFSNPKSGWTEYRGADYEHYYESGEFHFLTTKKDKTGNAWLLFRDLGTRYSIAFRAREAGGPNMNNYGLLFGGQNDDNYYAFRITGVGSFRVAKIIQDQWQDLVGWTTISTVSTSAWNTFSAIVQDTRVIFCLNGQALTTVDDASLRSGRVGMIVGAYDEPVHVHFDDFLVTKFQ